MYSASSLSTRDALRHSCPTAPSGDEQQQRVYVGPWHERPLFRFREEQWQMLGQGDKLGRLVGAMRNIGEYETTRAPVALFERKRLPS